MPPRGICGGMALPSEPAVALGMPLTKTEAPMKGASSMGSKSMPMKGWGMGRGGTGPGGWMMWMSNPITGSIIFAAGIMSG